MRALKTERIFNGRTFHRKLNMYYDTRKDAIFDAGLYRSMGYRVQITKAKDEIATWWFLWLIPPSEKDSQRIN